MTDRIEEDLDLETADRIVRRFGIEILDINRPEATSVMSMPIADLRNPFTGRHTTGPLAILIDTASGLVNHFGRSPDEWSVSSELALELSPDGGARADADRPVVAHARLLGSRGSSSLSLCTLTCGEETIGGGMVRSYFIPAERLIAASPAETLNAPGQELSDLMAVQMRPAGVLQQLTDPILTNGVGTVHGGVAAAALELVASAAINTNGMHMRTASVRVNFLRPFYASDNSRYEATPLRIGRGTAVADAHAVGEDGRVALTARVTAYR
jgi:uncharacterized protein (TIGR00369 family)